MYSLPKVETAHPGRQGAQRTFRAKVPVQVMLLYLLIGVHISHAAQDPPAIAAPIASPAPGGPPALTALPSQATSGAVTVPASGAMPQSTEPPVPRKPSVLGKTADHAHGGIQQSILDQAIRLDSFFGKTNPENQRKVAYLLRFRSGPRIEQGGDLNFATDVRFDIGLPKLNERLHLMVFGGKEPDLSTPRLPEDPGNPGLDRTFQSRGRIVNAELRYSLIRNSSAELFLGAGIGVGLPPDLFARSRFQYSRRLSDVTLFRFAETVFIKTSAVAGETTEIGLERLLDPKTILRWSSVGTVSEEIGALEWGSELALLHELSSSSAMTVAAGVYGNTGFDDWITNYRIYATYRRNFLRDWLFYELEPQISWPRQSDGRFPPTFAFTARLEVVFQGKEKNIPAAEQPK